METIGAGQLAVDENTVVGGRVDIDVAYVHERDAGGPNNRGLVAALRPAFGNPGAFSKPTDIDGGVVVAGARSDDDLASNAGAAFVWERDEQGNWQETEVAKLFASDGGELEFFGTGVAVEGDTIAVGAPQHSLPFPNAGAVYVFRRDEFGEWNEIAKLVADTAATGDNAGESVGISGKRVIAGAWGRSLPGTNGSGAGAVFVFEEDESGSWHQVDELQAEDASELTWLGMSVGLSGGTIAASAHLDDERGVNAGAAYVFQQIAEPSVSLSGTCPGAIEFMLTGATPSGAVALVGGTSQGLTVVPGGPCAGLELGIEDGRLLRLVATDPDGNIAFTRQLGPGACGNLLQAVDVVTCGLSAAEIVPWT